MSGIERCLVVEDHPQARQWLTRAVAESFGVTAAATGTVAGAREMIEASLPDLAIVDLGLPDGSGHEIIRELARRRGESGHAIRIVVATVMNDDENVFSAIREGADGYLLKEESQANLVAALKGISENRPALSPDIAMRLLDHFRADVHETPLTPRETEVLQMLAKGFTIAAVGEYLGITYHTTAGYVKEIYRKLEVNNRAEATVAASKRGLL